MRKTLKIKTGKPLKQVDYEYKFSEFLSIFDTGEESWLSGFSTNVYSRILCLTSEDREVYVNYCEKKFLEWLKFNSECEQLEDYLVEYLQNHEYHACYIEGEEYVEILEPLNQKLKDEAVLRIEAIRYGM